MRITPEHVLPQSVERREHVSPQQSFLAPCPHVSERAALHVVRIGLSTVLALGSESASAADAAQIEMALQYHSPAEEAMAQEVGVETMAIYHDVVRHFPYQQALDRIATVTGDDATALSDRMRLRMVIPYTADTARQISNSIETLDVDDALHEAMNNEGYLGFTACDDQLIALNIAGLHSRAEMILEHNHLPKTSLPGVLRALINKTLTHEFVHAVVQHDEYAFTEDSVHWLMEGFVESIALDVLRHTDPQHVFEGEWGFDFYEHGEVQAARFISTALGEQETIRQFVAGDSAAIEQGMSERFSYSAWNSVLDEHVWLPDEQYLSVAPLYALVRATYAHGGKRVVEEMNQRYPQQMVVPIEITGDCVGVVLLESNHRVGGGVAQVSIDQLTTLTYAFAPDVGLRQLNTRDQKQHWYVSVGAAEVRVRSARHAQKGMEQALQKYTQEIAALSKE